MSTPEPTPPNDDATDLADETAPPVSPAYSTPPPETHGTAEND